MERRQNVQTISWLYDLFSRERLDLDPPYQRKSVWTQQFKDYFVDTVLLNYPAPAIFLYEEISADGRSTYHVVDGKQRLTTIFEFIRGDFAIADKSKIEELRGVFFNDMPDDAKRAFWSYNFSIEYLPSSEEGLISDIFDRINRNVAKLTPQELRHAKLDGVFISEAERVAENMSLELGRNFPRLAEQSRKQMKDVELVASLFLLLELGPQSFSQSELDKAFLDRDDVWDRRIDIVARTEVSLAYIVELLKVPVNGAILIGSRLRNQVDFYSLVGAIDGLFIAGGVPNPIDAAGRLAAFVQDVDSEPTRVNRNRIHLQNYYDAARSASSDRRSRETRIQIIGQIITGALV